MVSIGSSSSKGYVKVNGQRYQKGDIRPVDIYQNGSIWMFEDKVTDTILIPATGFASITNSDTGALFGSAPAISAFVEAHFFFNGGGGTGIVQNLIETPTIPFDYNNGDIVNITVNGDLILADTNIPEGGRGEVLVKQGPDGGSLILPGVTPDPLYWAALPGEYNLLKYVKIDGVLYWTNQNYGTGYSVPLVLKTALPFTVNAYPVAVLDTNGDYVGAAYDPAQFARVFNSSAVNRGATGRISPGATPFEFLATAGTSLTEITVKLLDEMPLMNFSGSLAPSFPVGVFDDAQAFLTNALNIGALLSYLNATAPYNGLEWVNVGSSYFVGAMKDNPASAPASFKVMRYWYIDAVGAANIYISPTDVLRKADGTKVLGSAGTLGTYTNFGLNAYSLGQNYNNTILPLSDIKLVDYTSPYYIHSLTAGTNFIYHNENSDWAWCDVFGSFANNGGNVAPTVRHLSIQRFTGDGIIANLSIGNFANLSSLNAVEAISFNGQGINYSAGWMAYFPALKTFFMIDRTPAERTLTQLGLSKVTNPNLEFLLMRRSGAVTTATVSEWANMPALTKGLDMQGTGLIPAAQDIVLNALAANMGSLNAIPTARINTLYQNVSNRTAASDAAVATLTAKGFILF